MFGKQSKRVKVERSNALPRIRVQVAVEIEKDWEGRKYFANKTVSFGQDEEQNRKQHKGQKLDEWAEESFEHMKESIGEATNTSPQVQSFKVSLG